jgi:CheY-like chemotaxis protein
VSSANDLQSRKRIMVVDDEIDNSRVIMRGLEANGYSVDTFDDPVRALSNFHAGRYDLVLLDIKLPNMSGLELYAQISKIDGNANVCFLTASEPYYEQIKSSYPSLDIQKCFLRKPIGLKDLLKQIELRLGK